MFRFGKKTQSGSRTNVVRKLAYPPATHLEHYLKYYVNQLEPGYAVLVTGGWGSGKTHQVTAALPLSHAFYVSLFGLNSPEEIEGQIFSAMYPGKAAIQKIAEKVDSVSLDLPMLGSLGTGGLSSALTSVFIKNEVNTSKPLIFDDLERSTVDIKVLLGLINRFVEHFKCRVIVIAHDEKIVQGFTEAKEKVFGQTLVVEPNVKGAFEAFAAKFTHADDPAPLKKLQDEILKIFSQSDSDSLRVLRHVVEDFRRLVMVLEERHLANEAAMLEIVRLFSACAIEVRHGRINRQGLTKRQDRLSNHRLSAANGEGPPSPIVEASSKYTAVDFGSTVLQDNVLIEMLIQGRFVADHIRQSIDSSVFFMTREAARPWQMVGDFDRLEDNVVDEALKCMEGQFANREILDSGEFLHVVALKMMMAFRNVTNETVDDVKRAAIDYIDDLLAQDRLPPRAAGFEWYENFDGSYAGVSYWVIKDYQDAFRKVFDYLVKARGTALDKQLPAMVQPLLEVVRSNGRQFFEKVCYTRNAKTEYEDIPILAHVAAKDFVDAWLASPKTDWYWIGRALKERAKAAPQYPALKSEITWFPKVLKEMRARARAKTGLARLRIERAADLVELPLQPQKAKAKTASPA
ncbi:KAP family NTPase [Roseibium aggregatum]|uniref:KAP family NTPase n=1 Tax=Roseibium aggregatum TaxID=187304 RepID=UPI001E658A86|nr:KAP family NTPase [Roseibium aggregatum]UES37522.1 hypothetical protein GFC08_06395 [Roseibium aggregatum]